MKAVRPARAARSLSLAVLLATGTGLASATPAAAAPPPDPAAPLYESTDLAVSGEGAHTYRIPALETLPDGTLVAAYDRRNDSASDLPGNVDVMVRRSTDDGRTWSPPQAVADYDGGAGAGDPSLIADRWTGRLFLFHMYGPRGIGFGNAGMGNDHRSTTILHTDYHYSDDGGRSWRARRLTRDLKDPTWLGIFASSGTGIQLSSGRLLQQYALRKADASMWAASAYSDDHGRTWRLGTPVGPLMDENKTVELSLIHRDRTYSTPVADDELIDPVNNASILRYDPTAPPGHPRAHWLLFSNTASTSARRNLTVRLSCDDGRSWPVSRVVTPGPAAYSTLTRLKDGTFGLLYESGPYRKITFARFNDAWLGAPCPAG